MFYQKRRNEPWCKWLPCTSVWRGFSSASLSVTLHIWLSNVPQVWPLQSSWLYFRNTHKCTHTHTHADTDRDTQRRFRIFSYCSFLRFWPTRQFFGEKKKKKIVFIFRSFFLSFVLSSLWGHCLALRSFFSSCLFSFIHTHTHTGKNNEKEIPFNRQKSGNREYNAVFSLAHRSHTHTRRYRDTTHLQQTLAPHQV